MARLNPKRRLIAKIKAMDALAHEMTKAYNSEPINGSASVKSSLNPRTSYTHTAKPREVWEGTGKAARKSAKRWSVR